MSTPKYSAIIEQTWRRLRPEQAAQMENLSETCTQIGQQVATKVLERSRQIMEAQEAQLQTLPYLEKVRLLETARFQAEQEVMRETLTDLFGEYPEEPDEPGMLSQETIQPVPPLIPGEIGP